MSSRPIVLATSESSRRGRFRVSQVRLAVQGLPKSFEKYRFVHLTDLHYGPATERRIVEEALHLAQTLKPDLFVITGDFVVAGLTGLWHQLATRIDPKIFLWKKYRRKVRRLARELAPLLSELRAEDGTLAVLGNHDHIEGLGTVLRQLPKSIRWLMNESLHVRREDAHFTICGIDDIKRGKPDLKRSIAGERTGFSRVLLSHNPDVVLSEHRSLLSGVDLIICGHTHGGQIRLPGWGPVRTCTQQQDHIAGLTRFGQSLVYTNSGIGHVGLPFRLFCPPEIVVFEFTSG